MGRFDHRSNYTKNAGISSVVFGADSPVLEVELNEMQEIQRKQLSDYVREFGGDLISDANAITYKNGVLSIGECFIAVGGNIIKCTGLSINATNGQTVYVKVYEEDANPTTTLKEEGNQQSSVTVANNIKDPRYKYDTAYRTHLLYTLTLSPSSLDGASYAKIATIENSALKVVINTPLTSDTFSEHTNDKGNPHGVTKSQVGLGNADNTSDANKKVLSATKLTTARNINGVSFDGSKDINITANPTSNTLTDRDLNEIMTAGLYFASGGNAVSNKPSGVDSFGMMVYKTAGGYITQDLTEGNSNKGKRWTRQFNGTEWLSWEYIFTTAYKPSKSDVGLGSVPNVATNDQTPTYTQSSSLSNLTSGEKISVSFGKVMKAIADLITHLANKSNPHGVTKSQIGLSNVDNTSDANKPVSTATKTLFDSHMNTILTNNDGVHGMKYTVPTSTKDGILYYKDGNGNWVQIETGAKMEKTTVDFTEATTIANVNSGELMPTLFGKIKHLFNLSLGYEEAGTTTPDSDARDADTLGGNTPSSYMTKEEYTQFKSIGKVDEKVPLNADFNTYTTVGVFAVKNNTTADTVLNIPVNLAGKLIVDDSNGSYETPIDADNTQRYIIQTYKTYTNNGVYRRYGHRNANSEMVWETEWEKDNIKYSHYSTTSGSFGNITTQYRSGHIVLGAYDNSGHIFIPRFVSDVGVWTLCAYEANSSGLKPIISTQMDITIIYI